MKAKNKFDKYRYYFLKRSEIFVHGLNKSQIEGRKMGPKVILNSLPKSGTHLLESLFLQMPLMRHSGRKTLRIETQNPIRRRLKTIASLKKGQFLLGHLQYDESILQTTNARDIKIIHLIRDPRDVLISHLNYVERMDVTQKSHKFISQFDNRKDKLKAMMKGKEGVLEPFPVVLNKFQPWVDQNDVLCIKFEDLIGANGGGSNQKQTEAVKRICEFISIEVDADQLHDICQKIYSPKSSTFNKGKIGNWKNVLNVDEKEWLNEVIKNEINEYSYS